MADAERIVWAVLRSGRLAGRKFRRQYRVGNMILDFYSTTLRIAFELHGGAHSDGVSQELARICVGREAALDPAV